MGGIGAFASAFGVFGVMFPGCGEIIEAQGLRSVEREPMAKDLIVARSLMKKDSYHTVNSNALTAQTYETILYEIPDTINLRCFQREPTRKA